MGFISTFEWSQSHKTFLGINLLTLVCKLDLFIALRQLLLALIQRSSLEKSIFMPKRFYVIDPKVLFL
jgi:hypothetical protein